MVSDNEDVVVLSSFSNSSLFAVTVNRLSMQRPLAAEEYAVILLSASRACTCFVSRDSVERYKTYFSWLRNAQFLRELENDSVDSEIIEEELKALHVDETPATRREKVVKLLQSNPVQFSLCVIILLDAAIVVAQILLDINAVKDVLSTREAQLEFLLTYIRDPNWRNIDRHANETDSVMSATDIDHVIELIRQQRVYVESQRSSGNCSRGPLTPWQRDVTGHDTRTKQQKTTAPSDEEVDFISQGADLSNAGSEGYAVTNGGTAPCSDTAASTDVDALTSETDAQSRVDRYHQAAHALHYASIVILGLLVVEDLVKIIAMGRTFCEHKMEIFDAIIVVASFGVDIIFLGGVTGDEGQKAAGVVVVLLLWRIARVIDGIVITVKQRQEFRIVLLKRARRLAERKLDIYEDERTSRMRQIEALKDLCTKAGVNDDDIQACVPRNDRRVSSTMSALSCIARLSIGMTMSVPSQLCIANDGDAGSTTPVSQTNGANLYDNESNSRRYCHRYSFPECSDGSLTSFPGGAADLTTSSPSMSSAIVNHRGRRKKAKTSAPATHRKFSRGEVSNGGEESVAAAAEASDLFNQSEGSIAGNGRDGFQLQQLQSSQHNGVCAATSHESTSSPVNSTGVQIVIDRTNVENEDFLVVIDNQS